MTTYGAQMDHKWTGSGLEVGQKWTGCVHLSVRTSVHPKHFPYLLDELYARDLQAPCDFFCKICPLYLYDVCKQKRDLKFL